MAGNWSPPNLDPLFEDLPHGQHDDDSIPVDFICSLPNGVIVQSPPTHRRQEESSSQSSTSSTGASQLVGVRKKTVQWIPATGQFEVNQGCAVRLAELPPLPPSVAEPQKTSLTLSVHHADPKYSDPVRACESESCDSCCKKQQEGAENGGTK